MRQISPSIPDNQRRLFGSIRTRAAMAAGAAAVLAVSYLAANPSPGVAQPQRLQQPQARQIGRQAVQHSFQSSLVAARLGQPSSRQPPLTFGATAAALPFSAVAASRSDREQALECMTSAIYYEAGSESIDGQRAVAQVILNRVRQPGYPASICGVVYQGSTRATGCQFTFTCDGSLTRRPSAAGWARARQVAEAALSGTTFAPVGLATHYHADYVAPYWSRSLPKNAVVGAHIFYGSAGGWTRPSAFSQSYRGTEPDADALRRAALAAFAARSATRGSTEQDSAPAGPPAVQLASVEVQIDIAEATLGANHPKMVELRKQRAALAAAGGSSRATQLAALDAELKTARQTLGPKHPRILALEEERAALKSGRR